MDSAITTYLVAISIAFAIALVVGVGALTFALRETRRDRQARHESIPAYYGLPLLAG